MEIAGGLAIQSTIEQLSFLEARNQLQNSSFQKNIQFSGLERLGFLVHVLLKTSSGERCTPQNFVHLAIF